VGRLSNAVFEAALEALCGLTTDRFKDAVTAFSPLPDESKRLLSRALELRFFLVMEEDRSRSTPTANIAHFTKIAKAADRLRRLLSDAKLELVAFDTGLRPLRVAYERGSLERRRRIKPTRRGTPLNDLPEILADLAKGAREALAFEETRKQKGKGGNRRRGAGAQERLLWDAFELYDGMRQIYPDSGPPIANEPAVVSFGEAVLKGAGFADKKNGSADVVRGALHRWKKAQTNAFPGLI